MFCILLQAFLHIKKYGNSIYAFYYLLNRADKYNYSPAELFMYFIGWAEVQSALLMFCNASVRRAVMTHWRVFLRMRDTWRRAALITAAVKSLNLFLMILKTL